MSWGGSLPTGSRHLRKSSSRWNKRNETVGGLSLALSCRLSVSFIEGFMAWRNKFLISYFLFWKLKGIGREGEGSPPGRLSGSSSIFVRAGSSVCWAGGWQPGGGRAAQGGMLCPCFLLGSRTKSRSSQAGFGANFSCWRGLGLTQEKARLKPPCLK